jgi:hypothetical protein
MGALWGVIALLLLTAYRRKKREARAKLVRMEVEERAEDEAEPAAPDEPAPPEEAASPPPLPEDAAPPDGVHRVYRDGRYHTLH